MIVPAGALDDDPAVRPIVHIHTASKAPWYEIADALPQFAEYPAQEFWAKHEEPPVNASIDSAANPGTASTCPLCNGSNECAVASSGNFDTPCWCSGVTMDPAALARVPETERGRACLCRKCATKILAQ